MKNFKLLSLIGFLFFAQACASKAVSQHVDTLKPSKLDGAWTLDKCSCAGDDVTSRDMQLSQTIFINGNNMFQDQLARWKKSEWNSYCSIHEEAIINETSENSIEVTTVSERMLSPGKTSCSVFPGALKRIWKNISVSDSKFKFESMNGCETEAMKCTYKRLDK